MKNKTYLIVLVLMVSAIVRILYLGDIPAGFSLSEVKLAFFFGSPFLLRLPFALIGIIEVFLIYLASKRLGLNANFSLLISFMLAISPWHIQASRVYSPEIFGFGLGLLLLIFLSEKIKKHVKKITYFAIIILLLVTSYWLLVTANNFKTQVESKRTPTPFSYVYVNKYIESFRNQERLLFENLDFGNYFFSGFPREKWGKEEIIKIPLTLLPFIFIGLFYIEKNRLLLLSWSLIFLTFNQTLALLLPIIYLSVVGINKIIELKNGRLYLYVAAIFFSFEILQFGFMYTLGFTEGLFSPRRPVYIKLSQAVRKNAGGEQILVSPKLGDPEIYFKYYLKDLNFEFRNFDFRKESKGKLFLSTLPDDPSPSEPLYKTNDSWPDSIIILGEFYDKNKRQTDILFRLK